ncbi:MAG: hypothetical protein Q9224_005026 [Gallowayella concinna]
MFDPTCHTSPLPAHQSEELPPASPHNHLIMAVPPANAADRRSANLDCPPTVSVDVNEQLTTFDGEAVKNSPLPIRKRESSLNSSEILDGETLPFQIFFELPAPFDVQELAVKASRVRSLREDIRVVKSRRYKAIARKRLARRKFGDIDEAIYQYGKVGRRFQEREVRVVQLIEEFDETKAKVLQRLQNERDELEQDRHEQDPIQIRQERDRLLQEEEEVQEAEIFMQLEDIGDERTNPST